jgi:hypothetical protein
VDTTRSTNRGAGGPLGSAASKVSAGAAGAAGAAVATWLNGPRLGRRRRRLVAPREPTRALPAPHAVCSTPESEAARSTRTPDVVSVALRAQCVPHPGARSRSVRLWRCGRGLHRRTVGRRNGRVGIGNDRFRLLHPTCRDIGYRRSRLRRARRPARDKRAGRPNRDARRRDNATVLVRISMNSSWAGRRTGLC